MSVNLLSRLIKSERGGAMPIIGLAFVVITCSIGLAIDIGRGQLVEAKLYNALDTAGLAAGAKISNVNVQTEVERFVASNFPEGYVGATVSNVVGTASQDNKTIYVSATAIVPTTFMRILGWEQLTVNASSEITRSISGLEAILVLDNTGSMSYNINGTTGLAELKIASKLLLDNLYGDEDTVDKLYVGIVPFSQAVNVGPGQTGWLAAGSLAALDWGTTSWAGCVMARSNNSNPEYDSTDEHYTTEALQPYYWPDDTGVWSALNNTNPINDWINPGVAMNNMFGPDYFDTARIDAFVQAQPIAFPGPSGPQANTSYASPLNSSLGPNKNCPQEMTPMMQSKSTLKSDIDTMTAQGYTHINLGAAWGFRMLSPNWRGEWGGEMDANDLPLDYNTPLMNKAVVIMTDGDNRFGRKPFTAYGFRHQGNLAGQTSGNGAEGELDNRVTASCTAMKNVGINIYTVTYGADVSTDTKNLMRNCASNNDFFFDAPAGGDLSAAFQQIGDSLSNLRVSK